MNTLGFNSFHVNLLCDLFSIFFVIFYKSKRVQKYVLSGGHIEKDRNGGHITNEFFRKW